MKKKMLLTLGLLGVMVGSLLGGEAFAHDRNDRRDGWRNNNNRSSWGQQRRYYRPASRGNWWRNDNRVSYRPGNRWGNYRPAPKRGWW
ncbi:hypothetical protein [Vampirovibrio sp.]|uniref:hypothetical protein n=1 Tax=Vampirovibrio sp. TaxID=2717857 RepID=UPI003594300C